MNNSFMDPCYDIIKEQPMIKPIVIFPPLYSNNSEAPQKIIVSNCDLNSLEVNTFRDTEPQTIDVLESMHDLYTFISFKTTEGGYSSVCSYLKDNPTYVYPLPASQKLTSIGH